MVAVEVYWEAAAGEEISGRQMQADRENVKFKRKGLRLIRKIGYDFPGTSVVFQCNANGVKRLMAQKRYMMILFLTVALFLVGAYRDGRLPETVRWR